MEHMPDVWLEERRRIATIMHQMLDDGRLPGPWQFHSDSRQPFWCWCGYLLSSTQRCPCKTVWAAAFWCTFLFSTFSKRIVGSVEMSHLGQIRSIAFDSQNADPEDLVSSPVQVAVLKQAIAWPGHMVNSIIKDFWFGFIGSLGDGADHKSCCEAMPSKIHLELARLTIVSTIGSDSFFVKATSKSTLQRSDKHPTFFQSSTLVPVNQTCSSPGKVYPFHVKKLKIWVDLSVFHPEICPILSGTSIIEPLTTSQPWPKAFVD